MANPRVSIIAAVSSKNRALGKDNKLLWHISEDLKRFKSLTSGHPIIMGRKTFESIGRPLPNRTNIIITRNTAFSAEGCIVAHSLEEALQQSQGKPGEEEIFIIGGGEIYKTAIDKADKLYLTMVEGEFEADTFFPDYSKFKKNIFEQIGNHESYNYKFIELEK